MSQKRKSLEELEKRKEKLKKLEAEIKNRKPKKGPGPTFQPLINSDRFLNSRCAIQWMTTHHPGWIGKNPRRKKEEKSE